MRKLLIAPALLLGLAAAGHAAAEDAAPSPGWMTVAQITAKFTAEGYDVRQVKTEDQGYEVYAVAKDGRRIEVDVDPKTGAIVKSEADD